MEANDTVIDEFLDQLRATTVDAFFTEFSSCGRKFGKAADRDLTARIGLLQKAATTLSSSDHTELVRLCFFRGDNRERTAVLRALPLLPEPERFVPLAVEACRTNVQTVFEAIACDNTFPARHFAEQSFNQMVLKALFNQAPVMRIEALETRITPELVRMVEAYASERRAAGRPVPDDLVSLLALAKTLEQGPT
jgi:hypothetical protein